MKKQQQQSGKKGQSLITAGKINPIQWNISKSEAEIALKQFGIPVLEIKRVKCLKHQVCVSYWNIEGFSDLGCLARSLVCD